MAPPTVTMRCPSCGKGLRAVLAPAPPTQWFPCPSCHVPVPVVVPRDLPPLYSWEVLPGLYPLLALPRRPRWRPSTLASVALVMAAVLSAFSAGYLAYDAYVASEPAQYVVSGVVYEDHGGGVLLPASGALVVLTTDDNQSVRSQTTGSSGAFDFTGVPNGGIELNVTAPGYAATVVYTFASRDYSTQTQGLDVTLERAPQNNTTTDVLAPFVDLEAMLAYVGGASALLGGAAVVALVGSWAVRRPNGGVAGVIGAGAAVAVPVVLLLLSLGNVFLDVTIAGGAVGGAGAFALVFATIEVATGGSGSAAPP